MYRPPLTYIITNIYEPVLDSIILYGTHDFIYKVLGVYTLSMVTGKCGYLFHEFPKQLLVDLYLKCTLFTCTALHHSLW